MDRRQFIGMTAAGAAVLTLPAWHAAASPATVVMEPGLLSILRNRQLIGDIGHAYRKEFPRENDVDVLQGTILSGVGVSPAKPRTFRARLDRRVKADFEEGQTVTVNGWVLSVTEARQCALYSMYHA